MRRFSRTTLLLVLLAGTGCVTTAPRETRLSSPRVDVKLDTTAAIPVVTTVTINGRGPYRFALDTGCGAVFVSQRIARELDLADAPGVAHVVASNGEQLAEHRKVRVGSLRIGGADGAAVDLRDFAAIVDPLTPAADLNLDGFLGLSAFRNCVLALDVGGSVASVTSIPLPSVEAERVPLQIRGTVPIVPVVIRPKEGAETRLNLVIDSGGVDALCLPRSLDPAAARLEPTGVKARVWSLGGMREEPLYRSPATFEVGPLRFDGVADISRTDGQGFVGAGLLREMVVSIDQRGGTLAMRRR